MGKLRKRAGTHPAGRIPVPPPKKCDVLLTSPLHAHPHRARPPSLREVCVPHPILRLELCLTNEGTEEPSLLREVPSYRQGGVPREVRSVTRATLQVNVVHGAANPQPASSQQILTEQLSHAGNGFR